MQMAWYESKKGWGALVLAVYFGLDTYGRVESVRDIGLFAWQHSGRAVPFLPYVFVGLAIVFFELERRRGKRTDPNTLKARALKARDEMQKFLVSMGEPPEPLDGETTLQSVARMLPEIGRRSNLLMHKYELNFAAEVLRTYHEFGVRGIHDETLGWPLTVCEEKDYRAIIESLTKLAAMPEAETRV
jgi:hypothetical protein